MANPAEKLVLLCPHCGYNLTGLVQWRCPECGNDFSPDRVHRETAWVSQPLQWSQAAPLLIVPVAWWCLCLLTGPHRNLYRSDLVPWFCWLLSPLALSMAVLMADVFASRITYKYQLSSTGSSHRVRFLLITVALTAAQLILAAAPIVFLELAGVFT